MRHEFADPLRAKSRRWVVAGIAVSVPAMIGFGGVALAVRVLESYGWALFLGLPVLVSFLSGFIYGRWARGSCLAAYGVALPAVLFLGGLILLFAVDGLICLLMAFPLAAALALVGAGPGYLLGRALSSGAARALPLLMVAAFPLLVGFEWAHEPEPAVHVVTSSVTIRAPIERVWEKVIAFDRITKPPEGIFALGIAYPIRARIEGEGVGAIRHCIFSTGPFVEPITVWQRPRLLEFDVTAIRLR